MPWIRSATIAGSVSIGAGAAPAGAAPGLASGSVGMKSARSRMVCSACAVSGSPLHHLQETGAARRRSQLLGDLDEQSPAGLRHRPRGRQLPHGEPERLHRLGHHLRMTDGDVHVVLSVRGLGDREQRRDRPALDDPEVALGQAPFDVLRGVEVGLDQTTDLHDRHGLRVGERRLLLLRRRDRQFFGPGHRCGEDRTLLGGDRARDDLAVAHLEGVRVHQAGDQRLTEAEARLDRGDLSAGGDGVGREQDPRSLRNDHLLHDDGHLDLAVVETTLQAVGHGPLAEQRGPAPAHVFEDAPRTHDVQVGVVLAREGCARQVLGCRARSNGPGGVLPEPGQRTRNR